MREFPTPQEILKVFERAPGRTFRLRELVVELGLRSSQARELKNLLKGLARKKRIEYLKKNTFALAGKGAQGPSSSPAAVPGRRGIDDVGAPPWAIPDSRIPNSESRTPNPESRVPNPETRSGAGDLSETRIPSSESRIPRRGLGLARPPLSK